MPATPCSTVAFGPEMPGWGSWEWVGADVQGELSKYFSTQVFKPDEVPDADVVFVVKHAPPLEWAERVASRAALVYCPVDSFGSAAEIDACAKVLRKCSRVVVHCERLRKYFEPYAPVAYLDHHVKFCPPRKAMWGSGGVILWVGVHSNLPPLVEWVNAHPLPDDLRVLTNLEGDVSKVRATQLGFHTGLPVKVEKWCKEAQLERMALARAAIDVKGEDFRSRHKPPAKAIDFIAAGVPLAMNPGSSPVEHLARMGFDVASPLDVGRWLSREYWDETVRFGRALQELLSLERIGIRYRHLIEEVLAERR